MRSRGRVFHDLTRRARIDRLVEGDRDVRAERLLDADRDLGREAVGRAVEVAAERDPIVVHDAQVAERDDLEAAGIGEDRAVPGHEPVQAAEPLDPLVARSQVQVVRVGEDDRGADLADVVGMERLHGRVRADRHELRGLDDAVGQLEAADAGAGRVARRRRDLDAEAGGAGHASGVSSAGSGASSAAAGSVGFVAIGRSQSPTSSGSGRRGGGIS